MDYLLKAIQNDQLSYPNFLNIQFATHQHIHVSLGTILEHLSSICEKKKGKMVNLSDEDVEFISEQIINIVFRMYKFDNNELVDKAMKLLNRRIENYKNICLEEEYYEYLASIKKIEDMCDYYTTHTE